MSDAISGLLLRSGHMPCAVYFRPTPWEGPWKFVSENATLESAHGHLELVLKSVAVHGEAAIFVAFTEPPVPDREISWPTRFVDGEEPARLVYQITAAFRRMLQGNKQAL